MKTRIAVLVSGGGTNLQALIDAQNRGEIPDGEICLVVSNHAGAYALERAKAAGIPAAVCLREKGKSRSDFEARLLEILSDANIDLIILAGFMAILSANFVSHYPERIINVHPSLIPAFCGEGFYGLRVHEAALNYGVKVTGATVHYVNEIPDGGQIIAQRAVEIQDGDTPEILQRRVMEQAEWILLPQAAEIVSKKIRWERQNMSMTAAQAVGATTYPGRGIVVGKSADGKRAIMAYFIMGRSVNSRNRIFVEQEGGIRTQAFDPSKMKDPSLIIYAPVRTLDNHVIVTNGDQTDTIYDFLKKGDTFENALKTRCFEPDAPNFTPRVSAMVSFDKNDFSLDMSILRAGDAEGSCCHRIHWAFETVAPGKGYFLHTYLKDGDPIPAFVGDPEEVAFDNGSAQAIADALWEGLNAGNRVSLWVQTRDLTTGTADTAIINQNH